MARLIFLISIFMVSACSTTPDPVAEGKRVLDIQQQAETYYKNKNYKKSRDLYLQLANEFPSNEEIWFRLGNVYLKMGQREEAENAYREALARNPKHAKSWYNLSYMQAEALGMVVSEMSQNVDPADPLGAKMRIFSAKVLQPFNIMVEGGDLQSCEADPEEVKRWGKTNSATDSVYITEVDLSDKKFNPSDVVMTVGQTQSVTPSKSKAKTVSKRQAATAVESTKPAEKSFTEKMADRFKSLLE